jgi:hypothetical protein
VDGCDTDICASEFDLGVEDMRREGTADTPKHPCNGILQYIENTQYDDSEMFSLTNTSNVFLPLSGEHFHLHH